LDKQWGGEFFCCSMRGGGKCLIEKVERWGQYIGRCCFLWCGEFFRESDLEWTDFAKWGKISIGSRKEGGGGRILRKKRLSTSEKSYVETSVGKVSAKRVGKKKGRGGEE